MEAYEEHGEKEGVDGMEVFNKSKDYLMSELRKQGVDTAKILRKEQVFQVRAKPATRCQDGFPRAGWWTSDAKCLPPAGRLHEADGGEEAWLQGAERVREAEAQQGSQGILGQEASPGMRSAFGHSNSPMDATLTRRVRECIVVVRSRW